jgi:hypothetical protein
MKREKNDNLKDEIEHPKTRTLFQRIEYEQNCNIIARRKRI